MAQPSVRWSPPDSFILHRRGFASPQDEIKTVAQRVIRHGSFPIERGDQSVAGFFIRRAVKYWIKRHQRITGKVHLRHQTRGKRWSKNRKVNVRRSPSVVMIAPGIFPRTNRDEAIP